MTAISEMRLAELRNELAVLIERGHHITRSQSKLAIQRKREAIDRRRCEIERELISAGIKNLEWKDRACDHCGGTDAVQCGTQITVLTTHATIGEFNGALCSECLKGVVRYLKSIVAPSSPEASEPYGGWRDE